MSRRSAQRCVAGIAAMVGTLAVAACTSSGQPVAATGTPSVATTTESSPPAPTPPTTPPTTPAAPTSTMPTAPTRTRTSTPAPPTTAPVTSPPKTTPMPPSPPPTHVPQTTCTSIDVRVIRGSASLGQEIAALQFVNSGSKPCVLVGYPTATLLRKGKQIAHPSRPSSSRPSRRRLRPGGVAQSLLHDYSSCNAPLSDSVRVTVPGTDQAAVRPAELRGCILRVDRLGAPD